MSTPQEKVSAQEWVFHHPKIIGLKHIIGPEELALLLEAKQRVCTWTEDWEGNYTTSCGEDFSGESWSDTPLHEMASMKFCQACGGKLNWVPYVEPKEELES